MKVKSKAIVLNNDLKITLRSATPADAENLLQHLRVTHTESYKHLNQSAEYWDSVSVSDEENILANFESSTSKFMLVALHEYRIIGGLGLVGQEMQFLTKNAKIGMSIQLAFGNQGLGTHLLNYAIEWAKKMGFRRIELTVRTDNDAGIKLYESVGFERVGLLNDAAFIDGEFVNEYFYQKILG